MIELAGGVDQRGVAAGGDVGDRLAHRLGLGGEAAAGGELAHVEPQGGQQRLDLRAVGNVGKRKDRDHRRDPSGVPQPFQRGAAVATEGYFPTGGACPLGATAPPELKASVSASPTG